MSKAKHQLLVLVLVGALALAGCGGGEDADRNTTTQAPDPTASTQGHPGTESKQGGAKEGGSQSQSSAPEKRDGDSGKPAPTTTDPLPNEGTKRPAPGVPTNPGGDNSVQSFGTEAPAEDRIEAAASLQAFFDARAAGEWETACSYLAEGARNLIVKLGERVPTLKGADCALVLEGQSAKVPQPILDEAAQVEVVSFRVEEDRAFIVYRDSESTVKAMSMVGEGDGWKIASLDGVPLE